MIHAHQDDTEHVGTSRMENTTTGEELANTWKTRITADEVTHEIGASLDPTITQTVRARSSEAVAREREVERAKRNVIRQARKRWGDYAVPKPAKSESKVTYDVVACPDCEGAGELHFEGKLQMCPRCSGDGKIQVIQK